MDGSNADHRGEVTLLVSATRREMATKDETR